MECIKYTLLNLLFGLFVYGVNAHLNQRPPDAGLTTEEQVIKHKYPFENHFVVTEDGYVLSAHRIPYGKSKPLDKTIKRPVVLLMPGFWRSSEIWTSFGPESSLGFILADSGYDVWLGNYRGTTWGRRHVRYDADQNVKEFWNYSLDEIGYYDCPAFIDYVTKATGLDTLTYVGETIGATMFFIMGSEKPSYLKKVNFMVAMAPIVDIGKPGTPIYSTIAIFKRQLQATADYFGTYEVLRHTKWFTAFGVTACSNVVLRVVCEIIHSIGVGFNPSQLNRTAIPLLLNGFPAGSSLKQLIHLSQIYKTGIFAKYDYGENENLQKYKQSKPPVYNLDEIATPIALYYGGRDALVDYRGVERFAKSLSNVVEKKFFKNFNNGDFMWAKDVVSLLYEDMIKLIGSYQTTVQ